MSNMVIKPLSYMLAPGYRRGTLRLLDRTGYLHGRVMNFSVKSERYSGVNMQGEGLAIIFDTTSKCPWLESAHTVE
jgi:hypothetical protein